MAKGGYGFSDRFPHFKLFFVIALVLAIPLTVWSVNNASTNIIQNAQVPKCGPSNQNPSCPVDYTCEFTENNPLLGGNCSLHSLNPPKNPRFNASCKYNAGNPNIASFSLSWDNVVNSTGYKVYGSYYYIDQEHLITVNVGPYSTSTNSYNLTIPLPHGVKFFYWYVKTYNSVFKVTSPESTNSSIIVNCN